ncbi:MAG: hypothetical protein OYH77_00765, partial [Pseudomonadota bacterium]|nr:hypothetical protein [Pseudomonadota bacterium]
MFGKYLLIACLSACSAANNSADVGIELPNNQALNQSQSNQEFNEQGEQSFDNQEFSEQGEQGFDNQEFNEQGEQ